MRSDRGRTDVDRQPVTIPAETWPDGNKLLAILNGDRNLPLSGAKRGLDTAKQRGRKPKPAEPPVFLERIEQALGIAARLVHVGRLDFDEIKMHAGIERNFAQIGTFPHELPVYLAFGRHIDHHVAAQLCLTAQAAPGC